MVFQRDAMVAMRTRSHRRWSGACLVAALSMVTVYGLSRAARGGDFFLPSLFELIVARHNDLVEAAAIVKQVQPGGIGHAEAVVAMQRLNQATAVDVPLLLQSMDGANPIALNWMRGAVEAALDRGSGLPLDRIEAYLSDGNNSPDGRLLAYEILQRRQTGVAERWLPDMVDDPNPTLRRMAIDHLTKDVDNAARADAIAQLGWAVAQSRDVSQIFRLGRKLGELGVPVNFQQRLGVVNHWYLVGPFDNTDEAGFDAVMGPENRLEAIDLAAEYEGKQGTVKWREHFTADPAGMVDLNRAIDRQRSVVAYAMTEVTCDEAIDVQLRWGCINAHKVWVNSQLVAENNISHTGIFTDQYSANVALQKGKNVILLKICQIDQAQQGDNWMFQMRICDGEGQPIALR